MQLLDINGEWRVVLADSALLTNNKVYPGQAYNSYGQLSPAKLLSFGWVTVYTPDSFVAL
jgi:hypothetical protein